VSGVAWTSSEAWVGSDIWLRPWDIRYFDDFNRPDNVDPGPNWTVAGGSFPIMGNRLALEASGVAYYNTPSETLEHQFSQVLFQTSSVTSNTPGPAVAIDTVTGAYYSLRLRPISSASSGIYYHSSFANTGGTKLRDLSAFSGVSGSTLRLELLSGTTLVAYLNGVEIGRAGIPNGIPGQYIGVTGTVASTGRVKFDDWMGGGLYYVADSPTDPPVGLEGYLAPYVAGSWTPKPVKWWNGSAWTIKPAKYWNGSAWVVTYPSMTDFEAADFEAADFA
jgi:hypothetical protein